MSTDQWKSIARNNCTNVEEAIRFCGIQDTSKILMKPKFPFVLPRRLLHKMEKGSVHDPLFQQFIPLIEEEKVTPGFVEDPVGDENAVCGRGILQKYAGRVLFMATRACAMHCRFCFRRGSCLHSPSKQFAEELEHVQSHEDIEEVILSGGDPLSLPSEALADLCEKLNGMAHVARLRIHSRFIIGIPERIEDAFLKALSCYTRKIYFVLHVNHIRELDEDVMQAIERLRRCGVIILTQTVLLRGVNDSRSALQDLFTTLGNNGILPYYLHQLDRAQGTAHFEVHPEEGLRLMEDLRGKLSGYLIPRYVQEIPFDCGKQAVKK